MTLDEYQKLCYEQAQRASNHASELSKEAWRLHDAGEDYSEALGRAEEARENALNLIQHYQGVRDASKLAQPSMVVVRVRR